MIKCTICHRLLDESAFYPSYLKKHQHHCKRCAYEKWQKKSNKKYKNYLESLPDREFNTYYGGIIVRILNYSRKGELKYNIKVTDGELYQTNDVEEFMEKLTALIL